MAASMTRASGLRRGDLLGLAFFALLLIAFFVFWIDIFAFISPYHTCLDRYALLQLFSLDNLLLNTGLPTD